MELQAAEPSRGFAPSGPRGRGLGLSRAWLVEGGEGWGGARTPEILIPRGWCSREEFEGLRDALVGPMRGPGHQLGAGGVAGGPRGALGNTGARERNGRRLGVWGGMWGSGEHLESGTTLRERGSRLGPPWGTLGDPEGHLRPGCSPTSFAPDAPFAAPG